MLYVHPDLRKRMGDGQRMEAERRAENWRLLRQARKAHRSWVSRQGCWLACQLGHFLVRLGQQLQSWRSAAFEERGICLRASPAGPLAGVQRCRRTVKCPPKVWKPQGLNDPWGFVGV